MGISLTNRDVIWNYVGLIFRLGVNFFILPAILYFLNENELGLWYVFISLGSIASLLQLGFAPAIARNFAYCITGVGGLSKQGVNHAGENQICWPLLSNLFLVSRAIYMVISLVAIILLCTLGSLYIAQVSQGLISNAGLIWLIYAVGIFFALYFTYFESALRGLGHFADINKSLVASVIIQMVISYSLLLAGAGLIGPVIGYVTQGIIYRMLCSHYFWKSDEFVGHFSKSSLGSFKDRESQRNLFRALTPNALKDALVSVASYLVSQSNTLICASFLSLSDAGIFSLTVQLVNAVANFSSVYVNSCHPALQSAYASGDINREKRLISKSTVIYLFLFIICTILLCTVAVPFVRLIKPNFSISLPVILVMSFHYLLWKQSTNFAAYVSNRNIVPYCIPFVIFAAIGTLLTYFLCAFGFGLWGLVFGHLISQLIMNDWYWPKYVCKWFGIGYIKLLLIGLKNCLKR